MSTWIFATTNQMILNHGIPTAQDADEFLLEYTPKFNSMFAVEPENSESAYHKLPNDLILDHVLCVKQTL